MWAKRKEENYKKESDKPIKRKGKAYINNRSFTRFPLGYAAYLSENLLSVFA